MRKIKLLIAALAIVGGVNSVSAQTDVTTSYIGDVTWIVNGGGHSHSSSNHKESDGIGWWNTQTLPSGWHAFAAPNANGGVGESWTSGIGSAGVMMGRTMVLPTGKYTLSFDAFACTATNATDKTLPAAGDVVAFLTGQENVDITNVSSLGDATFHNVSFDFEVTTDNTAYEFGIKKLADESKPDWCQIKNVKLLLKSTNIFPVDNSSVNSFTYSGNQTWHTNTWSTEGQRDGSRFQVPFHELWVSSGNKLSDATIKGTYTPTETGVYKVSAWVRAMNEGGGAVTGAKIFVADVETDACTGSVVYDGKGRLGTYTAMADGVAGTAFEYGFKLENAEINWLAFKNVTITYLGTLPDEEVTALLNQVPTGKMNATVQAKLDEYVNALNTTKSVANFNNLSLYLPTAQASVAAYETISAAITNYAAKAQEYGYGQYDASTIQTKYDEGTYETLAEAEAELEYALCKAGTIALFGSDLNVTAPTTPDEAVTAVQNLNIAQYNNVASSYPYSLSGLIGDFGSWEGTATVNSASADPAYLSSEHWSGDTHAYYEQASTGYNSDAWTIKYEKTCKLPAGSYVIKVAARASVDVTGIISVTASQQKVALPTAGNNTKGINKAGEASWSEGEFARDGVGYGWQWRFLPFTLDEETEVTMTIYGETSKKYNWMSIADGELLSANDVATSVTYDETATNYIEDVQIANVTMNRTIKASYNTVVLPFALTANQVAAAFGTGTEVYAYSENSEDASQATINFNKNDGSISANVPVLIKATAASEEQVFEGVQVVAPANGATVAGTNFDFVGTYEPIEAITAGDYFVGNGALYKSEGATSMKAFRAYIHNKTNASVRFVIDGVEATGIDAVEVISNNNGKLYNLAGQEVKSAKKGLYIQNGKKYVVK